MTVRTTLFVIFAVVIAGLAGVIMLAGMMRSAVEEIERSEEQRYLSYKLADELRQSSDELTRLARTFAVTGNGKYETHFHEVLAIRNGEQPRPAGYDRVYWDIVLAGSVPKGASGETISLDAMMRRAGFSRAEFAKLQEARANSDALVQLEAEAMAAVHGRFKDDAGTFTREAKPDLEMARALTHGDAYHTAKAKIMAPINEFFTLLENRTSAHVTEQRDAGATYARWAFFLAIATVAFSIASLAHLHRKVLRPASELAARMQDISEGEGDLTQRMAPRGSDEFGVLARSFNVFINRVQGLMTQVSQASNVVAGATTQLAVTTRQQEGTVLGFGHTTTEIASASAQISATSQELAGTVRNVTESARRTGKAAQSSRSALDEMDRVVRSLQASMERVSLRLGTIDTRAVEITKVVTTITQVADQTNLLSVNAAIESEKAGEAGRGFLVVAREIRRLADQTAGATLHIEDSVRQMQEAVAAGVTETQRFADQVGRGVQAVSTAADEIGRIIEEVHGLGNAFSQVDDGMEQQNEGARRISDSMSALRDGAGQTAQALKELARTSEHLQAAVGSLRDEVGQFRIR
ncbi:MAG: methyl-accepting chemotaxis protein [Planctomycetota bacterium]|nr:methyl-accepting chemotaxis protein [Planctomycetota bacterium]